jgi:hypothetical protein
LGQFREENGAANSGNGLRASVCNLRQIVHVAPLKKPLRLYSTPRGHGKKSFCQPDLDLGEWIKAGKPPE